MTVIPFPPIARRQPATPSRQAGRRMDRAAVATAAVFQIVGQAMRARYAGDETAITHARFDVEELLRDEFHDAEQQTLSEIRLNDE